MATPTTTTTTEVQTICPVCQTKAKRVSLVTITALLKHEFAREVSATAQVSCCPNDQAGNGCSTISESTGWRFCDSKECEVVYFSEADGFTFEKSQLRVPVGVKETSGERPICYCFCYSLESIKREIRISGISNALAEIRKKMKDPGCRCETENPSGNCCLASVAKGIETAEEELENE